MHTMNYEREIKSALESIAKRRTRPKAWLDALKLPWKEAGFSKWFLECEELPPETANGEAEFLLPRFINGPVLELGCGGGRSAQALLASGLKEEFVGIDIGPVPLKVAQERCGKAEFVRADMLSLPFSNEKFANVFSVYGAFLGFSSSEAETVLNETRRVLRKEGTFVLEFPSLSFLRSLDGVQEWWVSDRSFAGNFSQLGLSENYFLTDEQIYIRRDFVVDLRDGTLAVYGQSNCAYCSDDMEDLLHHNGFTPLDFFGDWAGMAYSEDSERLIVISRPKD